MQGGRGMKKIIIRLIIKYFGDDIASYWANEQNEKAWYKARRAGYKRKDLGFYYSDLEIGKHTNVLGQTDNNIYL